MKRIIICELAVLGLLPCCGPSDSAPAPASSSNTLHAGPLGSCCDKLAIAVKTAGKWNDWSDTIGNRFVLDEGKLFELKKNAKQPGIETDSHELVATCPFCGKYIQKRK